MLYEMRLDGFCSLKTWGREGVLRTKVIIPHEGDMRLNVRTMAHTGIRVQMLDGMTRAANPRLHMGGGGYNQRRPSPRPARAGASGMIFQSWWTGPCGWRFRCSRLSCLRSGWPVMCTMRVSRWGRCGEMTCRGG